MFSTWANEALKPGDVDRRHAAARPLQRAARRDARAPLPGLRRGQRHHAAPVDRQDDAGGGAAQPLHAGLRQPRVGHRDVQGGAGGAQGHATSTASTWSTCCRARRRTSSCCTAASTAPRPTRCSRTGSPLADVDTAFVCGPEGMMEAVIAALQGARLSRREDQGRALRGEHSRSTRTSRPPRRAPATPNAKSTVIIDGATRTFTLEKAQGEPARRGAAQRHRAAVLVQGRRVLDLPLPRRRRRGRHGRQLRARGLRGRARLHPRVPELSGHRQGRGRPSTTPARADARTATPTLSRWP